MADPNANINPFFKEILLSCNRIRAMDGSLIFVSHKPTTYVLPGHTFTMSHKDRSLPFWVGVNGKRLFFIAYNNCTPEVARDKFKFAFGGASAVGWNMNYESIELMGPEGAVIQKPGVSIWGNCMTDEALIKKKEVQEPGPNTVTVRTVSELTESGLFWAIDIALMAQSWFRTCERSGIERIEDMEPAPL